jgi:peroxiredoxin
MGHRGLVRSLAGRFVLASLLTGGAAFGKDAPAKTPPHFSLADTTGAMHSDAEWKGSDVVLFFLTTDCPISNGYVPEMNRIAKDYLSRGVRTYGIMTDTSVPLADVRKHVKDFAFTFPVLIDPTQILVKYTNVDTNPEGAVVSPRTGVVYMGRIDNKVENFGQQRQQATEHELRNALDASLAGKPVAKTFAQPIGCSIIRVN